MSSVQMAALNGTIRPFMALFCPSGYLANSTKPDGDNGTQPHEERMTDTLSTLKAKIETEVAALNTAIRTGLRHARTIGEYLLEAKVALKGEEKGFVAWVKQSCPFSYPSAANYMRIAGHWDRFEEETLAKFTIREFLSAVAERAPRKKTAAKNQEQAKAGAIGTSEVASATDEPTVEVVVATEPAVKIVSTEPTVEIVATNEPIAPKKTGREYTSEYASRMAAECGIVAGDVIEFLRRFGVRVEEIIGEVAA